MEIKRDLLTVNKYSRPGKKLNSLRGIVIHWVGNPGSTAQGNRNYFENLKAQPPGTEERYASAHYIIGLEGEVIQCIPNYEMAYHVGAQKYTPLALKNLSSYPNDCTLGIELCHPDWTGEFNDKTLGACHILVCQLLEKTELTQKDVYRHFDITGKGCPLYFVQHEDKWQAFLDTIGEHPSTDVMGGTHANR
jgi:N-acetylmuramoyl-L-alanine amidase